MLAWELQQQGVACTLIADNTGGHLMQKGLVDICIVGSDRTTASGDVCNKIGTYLKALAAQGVRFARTMKRGQKAIVYGIRNVLEPEIACREFLRVLRPGGRRQGPVDGLHALPEIGRAHV